MASLSKKGIIEIDYDDHVDYFWFTDFGKALFVDFHDSWTLANETR